MVSANPFSARLMASAINVLKGSFAYLSVANKPATVPGTPLANRPSILKIVIGFLALSKYISFVAFEGADSL